MEYGPYQTSLVGRSNSMGSSRVLKTSCTPAFRLHLPQAGASSRGPQCAVVSGKFWAGWGFSERSGHPAPFAGSPDDKGLRVLSYLTAVGRLPLGGRKHRPGFTPLSRVAPATRSSELPGPLLWGTSLPAVGALRLRSGQAAGLSTLLVPPTLPAGFQGARKQYPRCVGPLDSAGLKPRPTKNQGKVVAAVSPIPPMRERNLLLKWFNDLRESSSPRSCGASQNDNPMVFSAPC